MFRRNGECRCGGPHTLVYAAVGTFTIAFRRGSIRTVGKPKALKCSKCRQKL